MVCLFEYVCDVFFDGDLALEVAMFFVCELLGAQAPTTGQASRCGWVVGCMHAADAASTKVDTDLVLVFLRRAMLVGFEMIGVNGPCRESVLVRGIQRFLGTPTKTGIIFRTCSQDDWRWTERARVNRGVRGGDGKTPSHETCTVSARPALLSLY